MTITEKHLEGQLKRLHGHGYTDLVIEKYMGYKLTNVAGSHVYSPYGLTRKELYMFMAGMLTMLEGLQSR